jgi:hypothetical protein
MRKLDFTETDLAKVKEMYFDLTDEKIAWQDELNNKVTHLHSVGLSLETICATLNCYFRPQVVRRAYKELGFNRKVKVAAAFKEPNLQRVTDCHNRGLTLMETIKETQLCKRTVLSHIDDWPQEIKPNSNLQRVIDCHNRGLTLTETIKETQLCKRTVLSHIDDWS